MYLNQLTYLVDLYKDSASTLTANSKVWQGLLDSIGHYHMRSFDNIVLIHTQNPDVTQIGTKEEWAKVERTVNPDTESIAVIDLSSPSETLKYYYDISDTSGSLQSYQYIKKRHWKVEATEKQSLFERITSKEGIKGNSLEEALYSLSKERVAQFQEFNDSIPDNLTVLFQNSVYYVIANRMGLNIRNPHFEGMEYFNHVEAFSDFGIAI